MQHRYLLIVLITFATNASSAHAQISLDELWQAEQRILDSVQQMRAVTVGVRVGTATASGVVLEDGFVLTAAHAVQKTGQPAVIFLTDGSNIEATVHGIDHRADVALLKLSRSKSMQFAKLSPRDLTTFETVVAVGNPFGFDPKRPALVRLGRAIGSDVLQSSCRIARGDSGGPLFDLQGRLIGIHRQILKNNNANFHTAATMIAKSISRLRAGETIEGKPARPVLKQLPGRTLSPNLNSKATVEVYCERHFVGRGTIVDGTQGLIVVKASELRTDDKISVYPSRRKAKVAAKVLATDRASDLALLKADGTFTNAIHFLPVQPKIGQLLISISDKPVLGVVGAMPRSIPRQRGVLGLQVDDNLVVTSIQPTSAASAAGIRAGDKLEKLDGEQLDEPSDIGRLLKSMNAGDRFRLTVLREERTRLLFVQLRHPASQRFNETTFLSGAGGVSNLRRTGFPLVVQHDASLSARDCVGPVMTLDGKFAGINIARAGREAVLMVPADVVQRFVEANTVEK
ncbi:MAG: S1C family serine protease [Planctomycetaceae bacterium]